MSVIRNGFRVRINIKVMSLDSFRNISTRDINLVFMLLVNEVRLDQITSQRMDYDSS